MKLSSSVTSGLTILAASFLVGAAMDTEATGLVQGRKLQPSCQQNLAGADIVILFDESGSMEEEQDTAAAHTVTMFNAFAARTGATPRFAVGGFGRKDGWFHDELHELTDNFVTNTGELWSALNRLVTDGSYEEGYKALVDTFDRNNGYLRWDFQPGSRICAIIFTDEDSDGSTSAGDVNRAKGANAIIPVVSEGGNRYSAVSSLPGGQVLSLVEFVRNPAPTIMTIVNACVTALSPNAVCKNYALPHDGTCKRSAGANAFNGGSFDPQGDNLALSIYPPGPFPVSGVSTNTQVILSVSDPLANCDTCQATMTVTNAPPTAACKDITVPVNDASCVYVPTDLSQQVDNGSSDSDGSAGPTFNASPQGPFSVGQHVITLEVTDNCGAKASCTSTVTVTNSPPETKCQDIERVVDSACKWSPSSSMESEIDNGSVDGEGFGFGLSVSASGPFDGSYGGTSFPVTLTGTDSCGATSECVATVTLKDETPPTAACELAANPSGAYTMTGDDNCGAVFYVVDTGSGTEWGPYAAGTVFEYTKDPGAQPAIEAGEAGADWIINGMGNPYIKAVDGSGNESDPGPADSSDAWCADVPEPKTPPPEPTTTTSTTTSTTTTTTTTTTASQPLPPPPPPGAGGDPHFKTWSGNWYDYHGQCDLVLLHNPGFYNELGLDIHVRTKIRHAYSYIESIAVQIGNNATLEVTSYGGYFINGVLDAGTPFLLSDKFLVEHETVDKKHHTFDIHLDGKDKDGTDDAHIVISTFKDLVNIKIVNATKSHFESSIGMMGTFGSGSLVARDGKTMMMKEDVNVVNAFGQEWQVRDTDPKIFQQTHHVPQYPEACLLPSLEKVARRLGEGIARSVAEEACGHWTGEMKEMCVFDVLATNDIEVAQAHGAFF